LQAGQNRAGASSAFKRSTSSSKDLSLQIT
jgi:hypothetical protein